MSPPAVYLTGGACRAFTEGPCRMGCFPFPGKEGSAGVGWLQGGIPGTCLLRPHRSPEPGGGRTPTQSGQTEEDTHPGACRLPLGQVTTWSHRRGWWVPLKGGLWSLHFIAANF